ncbi:class I SAM-dependent methyltransferase [Clostridium botulinum]|uniref:class I SAM-dependent methyltransferase n=1 Tax=Clostridium TaxID=1485 RepID=UPI0013F88CA1|nr:MULTISPECIES: class I SAM-dependent methyltransferase [Clostridium]MCS6131031.1 class I SAM-dependent methyltransferase [Clostridium botulinum]NFL43795.1 class I SAM-dependent methyltransferase [Clostridium botulinum]NFL88766.1 class I SAM-dependent methyltransferase [Clostridium botulinum]
MEKFSVIEDKIYKYKRLDPVPTSDELNEFYGKEYYEIKKKNDIGSADRFINDKKDKDEELLWLQKTEYRDAYTIFHKYFTDGQILDIGCGSGEFLSYMGDNGFGIVGIEPSIIAYEKAKERGLEVYNCDLFSFLEVDKKFDIINMTNVLEHIPEPVKVIAECKKLLNKNGIIRIKVPNEFSQLQLEAIEKFNKEEYWVAIPDHVNYFNFESLTNLLTNEGFEIINKTVDFPMELFMFMGEDYVKEKSLGKICHEKRKKMEMNLSEDMRRKLYDAFAQIGLGRNIYMYAILK